MAENETATDTSPDGINLDRTTIAVLHGIVAGILDARKPCLCGVALDIVQVTHPQQLLPAIVTVAAEEWAPVVMRNRGRGGFDVRLTRDDSALLGYTLAGIRMASPFLLYAPVSRVVTGACREDSAHFDRVVDNFRRLLNRNGYDTNSLTDLDVRVIDAVMGAGNVGA